MNVKLSASQIQAQIETNILRKMEAARREIQKLAKELAKLNNNCGMTYLQDDIHKLRGRFMQVANTQEWQLDPK
jgi:DNA mismatch repair ATPase MutS